MVSVTLTEGALCNIMKGANVDNPVVQILGTKRIASGNSDKDRFRLLISDGKNLISFAMLATQIGDKQKGELAVNTIMKIKRYITSVINNTGKSTKRVLVILEYEVVVPGEHIDKIGNPEALSDNIEDANTNLPQTSHSGRSNIGAASSTADSPTAAANASICGSLIHPISSLSPYQNKWVIKARVASKTPIRSWSNARGEGTLFSCELVDETGQIRVTAFRDLVDKFYNTLEIDKIYYITKCQLKVANKQFNSTSSNYEMTFTDETVVEPCQDNNSSIPRTKYDFLKIERIASIETGHTIDVIGICKSVSDVATVVAKSTGKELKKRQIELIDQTNCSIELTLWGTDAESFDGASNPVIAIKNAKVGEFGGGKNLSVMIQSITKINPDIPEAHQLRSWFNNIRDLNINLRDISARSTAGGFATPWKTFEDLHEEKLGTSERGDYFQNKATVLLFRSDRCYYKACPNESCNRKVQDQENGMYRCEACNREYHNFKYRLLGVVNLCDSTRNQWVSMFASEAEKVLNMTSEEVGENAEKNPEFLLEITEKVHLKQFMFKYRAKMEVYNDEHRLKVVVVKAEPLNYKEYNAHLVSKIRDLISN